MNNRDMYYQNLNQGYTNQGMIIPPSGYNMNTNYQAYGPNIIPNEANNNYDERIATLERQIRKLDIRLQKLESATTENDNLYMI